MASLEVHSYGQREHSGTRRLDGSARRNQRKADMASHDDLEAPERLLTPSEVAALFRVNPKTVTRWARAGKLSAIRTLGGHRRFRASEIRRCLDEMSQESGR